MGNIRIACHAITWGRDGLTACLADLRDRRFRGIETFGFVVEAYTGRERAFADLLAEHGLRLVSLYGGGQMDDPAQRAAVVAENLALARFLAANGAVPLTLGPGQRPPGGPSNADLRQMATTMNEIGRRSLEEYGVLACCHPHWNTTIQERDEITRIFELVDPRYVFMTADPAHMAKAGYDPVEVFRTYRDIIKYVHIKDYRPLAPDDQAQIEGSGGMANIPDFVELGLGIIDLPALVATLKEADFDGWVTVELDRSTRGPRVSLEMNQAYLEDTLGLRVDQDNPF
ncbi:MAG: sugar phosphate isomerase/epimerase [Chloroflexi bacterium]|nr:sugar phosphate isomerase/epimerase [Chloroflexota bacterium]